jgi:hypothetical protein
LLLLFLQGPELSANDRLLEQTLQARLQAVAIAAPERLVAAHLAFGRATLDALRNLHLRIGLAAHRKKLIAP